MPGSTLILDAQRLVEGLTRAASRQSRSNVRLGIAMEYLEQVKHTNNECEHSAANNKKRD